MQTKRVYCQNGEEKLPIAEDARKAAFKSGLDATVALNGGEVTN